MGDDRFTRAAAASATATYVPPSGRTTRVAEERARQTGKLDPDVDPAGYEGGRYMARPSRIRFSEPLPDGTFEVTDGTPLPIETLLDTTGSMRDNVDKAIRSLADTYEMCHAAAPYYHLHLCVGTFGDVLTDDFPYCRSQFEMVAEKMVIQLSKMVCNNNGGENGGEDPQYGLFAAAYLTDFYINKIGMKGYHFLVTDEPARDPFVESYRLRQIFGDKVMEVAMASPYWSGNEHEEARRTDALSVKQVVQDMLRHTHGFVLVVGGGNRFSCNDFWTEMYGPERVIMLPRVELLAATQATLIDLTEGLVGLSEVEMTLISRGVELRDRRIIMDSVANIPLAAQQASPNWENVPMQGDIFRSKDDLWPISRDSPRFIYRGDGTVPPEKILRSEEQGSVDEDTVDEAVDTAAGPSWL